MIIFFETQYGKTKIEILKSSWYITISLSVLESVTKITKFSK